MAKMIGAVMILAGCFFVGFFSAATHNRELKTLQKLVSALDLMSCELQYRLTPLPELCRLAAKEANGTLQQIFSDLSTELECQVSPDVNSCMQIVLEKHEKLPQLTRNCLDQLGASLGRFDLAGQVRGLEAVRQRCRFHIDKLENNREERLRSYRTLGLCAGAALVILFV